ncbi:hypothetical protein BS47DRAFT_1369063 [Hydnum rufescens UP504]|uniref:Uncharacterized protein n=1 Tax=Hydnum rufescens UP504 TaxID=1448309 RepID=A0A9P6AEV9_9AGAM|nr:hypothetical protein BS47DRAFT_1369063 [Hydnum rufescens UP504]
MKPPAAPGIDTRPVRMGTTRIMTYPNKSLHLKSRTVCGHRVKRGTTHPPWWILNSNLYEPAEPNPMTPNPPNECPPNEHPPNEHPPNKHPPNEHLGNEHPPHEHLPNEHPPNENLPYEHHPPPKPDNPPNEHGPNGLLPNQTFQTTHPPKQVFSLCEDPPDEDIVYHTPASADQAQGKTRDHTATHTPPSSTSRNIYEDETNMVPHTHFGGYLHCLISDSTNAQTRSKAKHGTALPPIPLTLDFPQQRNTKQIWCDTPAEVGYHTIDTACDIPPL